MTLDPPEYDGPDCTECGRESCRCCRDCGATVRDSGLCPRCDAPSRGHGIECVGTVTAKGDGMTYDEMTDEQRRKVVEIAESINEWMVGEGAGLEPGSANAERLARAFQPPSPLPSDAELRKVGDTAWIAGCTGGAEAADAARRGVYAHALRLAERKAGENFASLGWRLEDFEIYLGELANEMEARNGTP